MAGDVMHPLGMADAAAELVRVQRITFLEAAGECDQIAEHAKAILARGPTALGDQAWQMWEDAARCCAERLRAVAERRRLR